MAIRFPCGRCSSRIRVPEDAAGRTVRCPRCGSPQDVPAKSVEDTNTSSATKRSASRQRYQPQRVRKEPAGPRNQQNAKTAGEKPTTRKPRHQPPTPAPASADKPNFPTPSATDGQENTPMDHPQANTRLRLHIEDDAAAPHADNAPPPDEQDEDTAESFDQLDELLDDEPLADEDAAIELTDGESDSDEPLQMSFDAVLFSEPSEADPTTDEASQEQDDEETCEATEDSQCTGVALDTDHDETVDEAEDIEEMEETAQPLHRPTFNDASYHVPEPESRISTWDDESDATETASDAVDDTAEADETADPVAESNQDDEVDEIADPPAMVAEVATPAPAPVSQTDVDQQVEDQLAEPVNTETGSEVDAEVEEPAAPPALQISEPAMQDEDDEFIEATSPIQMPETTSDDEAVEEDVDETANVTSEPEPQLAAFALGHAASTKQITSHADAPDPAAQAAASASSYATGRRQTPWPLRTYRHLQPLALACRGVAAITAGLSATVAIGSLNSGTYTQAAVFACFGAGLAITAWTLAEVADAVHEIAGRGN